MDELRKADAPDYAINAWEAIILGSPAELDDLLTAHPELLQWPYGKCKTRDGSSFSRDLLSLAIAEGDTRLMDVVLRHGVSPNRLWPRPADGELCSTISLTPLAEVVRQHGGGFPETEEKAYDLLNFLIARGADVDKPVSDGSTPLHLAAGLYCEGIVSFHLFTVLKALGAKDDVLNAHEETPLDVLNANLRLNGIILQDKEN